MRAVGSSQARGSTGLLLDPEDKDRSKSIKNA
jgi:hypothetical protein